QHRRLRAGKDGLKQLQSPSNYSARRGRRKPKLGQFQASKPPLDLNDAVGILLALADLEVVTQHFGSLEIVDAGAKGFSTLVVFGRGINHRQRHLDWAVVTPQLRQFARLRQLVTPFGCSNKHWQP